MRADDQLISDTVEPRTSMPIRGINSDRNIGHSLSTRTLRAPLPWLKRPVAAVRPHLWPPLQNQSDAPKQVLASHKCKTISLSGFSE
jgi:hypothetical protein